MAVKRRDGTILAIVVVAWSLLFLTIQLLSVYNSSVSPPELASSSSSSSSSSSTSTSASASSGESSKEKRNLSLEEEWHRIEEEKKALKLEREKLEHERKNLEKERLELDRKWLQLRRGSASTKTEGVEQKERKWSGSSLCARYADDRVFADSQNFSRVSTREKKFQPVKEKSYQWKLNLRNSSDVSSRAADFCQYLPVISSPWPVTSFSVTEEDLLVGVFTGEPYYMSRAMSSRDTWFDRLPKGSAVFYSSTPEPLLPITSLGDFGEDYWSALRKQLLLIPHMYKSNPNKKWYVIIGCDNYLVTDHLIWRLSQFDHNKPLYLGNMIGTYNLAKPQLTVNITYGAGGSGIYLSNALMKLLAPTIQDFVDKIWPKDVLWSDVATAYAIKLIGYSPTLFPVTMGDSPEYSATFFSTLPAEPASLHFLTPMKMFDVDEYFISQKFDRLAHLTLVQPEVGLPLLRLHLQRFVTSHFVTMRKKYFEVEQFAKRLGRKIVYGIGGAPI